jgi:hypothetical protein
MVIGNMIVRDSSEERSKNEVLKRVKLIIPKICIDMF